MPAGGFVNSAVSTRLFPKAAGRNAPPETIVASGSHSQPMGHFPVEQWNCTSQIMEHPGTMRLVDL